jgi:hypothetical protein
LEPVRLEPELESPVPALMVPVLLVRRRQQSLVLGQFLGDSR